MAESNTEHTLHPADCPECAARNEGYLLGPEGMRLLMEAAQKFLTDVGRMVERAEREVRDCTGRLIDVGDVVSVPVQNGHHISVWLGAVEGFTTQGVRVRLHETYRALDGTVSVHERRVNIKRSENLTVVPEIASDKLAVYVTNQVVMRSLAEGG